MAITKERLEELIKEEATIWGVADYGYHESKPYKRMEYFDLRNTLTFYNNNIDEFLKMNYNIEFFETKEDAEFALRYQNITRTETLSLPTFNKFKKIGFPIIHCKNGNTITIAWNDIDFSLWENEEECIFAKALTKENYLKACELCRKLFLDEEI